MQQIHFTNRSTTNLPTRRKYTLSCSSFKRSLVYEFKSGIFVRKALRFSHESPTLVSWAIGWWLLYRASERLGMHFEIKQMAEVSRRPRLSNLIGSICSDSITVSGTYKTNKRSWIRYENQIICNSQNDSLKIFHVGNLGLGGCNISGVQYSWSKQLQI